MNETEPEDMFAPLDAPLISLPGVGARAAPLLAKVAGGQRVMDLLLTLPDRYILRAQPVPLAQAAATCLAGDIVTTTGRVARIERASRPRQPSHIFLRDENAEIDLVFFNSAFIRNLAIGQSVAVSGIVELYHGRLTMPQPDYLVPAERRHMIPAIEPVWPLTAGLFTSTMRRAVSAALATLPSLPEWLDPALLRAQKWPPFKDALVTLHAPDRVIKPGRETEWPDLQRGARERLACDRLFHDQLALGATRMRLRQQTGSALIGTAALQKEALSRFGHDLTNAQQRVIHEITGDLTQPSPMLRLLQGDVGSGKTIVALLAMLHAVEAGMQAAMMAPTELLARQHFTTISALSPVRTVFLSGNVKGKARREALAAIADGAACIVIGTHALFQDGVAFAKLGLCVIDEQHRFGVTQRVKLSNKGENVNMLVMTATPIPRTLLLTRWGELAVSRIDEKPKGRLPIQTSLHPLSAISEVYQAIGRKISEQAQIYWVCPLIEESEKLDLAAAEARYESLERFFPGKVALVHGRQDSATRQAILQQFREGLYKILVATTVIEVGVDVPQASVMVIEHAERFGLAQLHQLRGRVGRGHKRSYCLLLFDKTPSFNAQQRLTLLKQTEDGFLIAEEDHRLRGGGDIAGRRQTGLPDPRLLNGVPLEKILEIARQLSDAYWRKTQSGVTDDNDQYRLPTRIFNGDQPWDLLASG
ncbi:ATP-dependent DNA helicase RecG [Candidatus Kirkpatrickella diaphorinae]|uniref:ATP-dependent DNA helicase RecG n=1 Tax=Candidatus Kirkpatrickella diaphorinae TaxID=2984322 RepID=A0ABY6GKB5_9PROT|nr:ATP-dependent DNA helicase RecG [Candidatus Kirkpatrickella diaphorinae]UYH51762.1 ATP-dependent DNA helicase RecG [Candidatus Kirkpatrickella diaphorinae]